MKIYMDMEKQMRKTLCALGIHKYNKWVYVSNNNGKPLMIELYDSADHRIGQVFVRLRECAYCGKVQTKRIKI